MGAVHQSSGWMLPAGLDLGFKFDGYDAYDEFVSPLSLSGGWDNVAVGAPYNDGNCAYAAKVIFLDGMVAAGLNLVLTLV